MAFDWMTPTPARRDRGARVEMYRAELTARAAVFYRLGYSAERATERLRANVAWDFERGAGPRPDELADDAIADLVAATYARRPAR